MGGQDGQLSAWDSCQFYRALLSLSAMAGAALPTTTCLCLHTCSFGNEQWRAECILTAHDGSELRPNLHLVVDVGRRQRGRKIQESIVVGRGMIAIISKKDDLSETETMISKMCCWPTQPTP